MPGQVQVFGGEGGREDLNHAGVLDPEFHDMEAAGAAALETPASPALTLCNRGHLVLGYANAEGEVGRSVTRWLAHGEAGGAKLGPRRVDLDSGAELVLLAGEPAAGVGRKPRRRAAHQFGKHFGDVLGIAGGDRQVMDHGVGSLADGYKPSSLSPGWSSGRRPSGQ